MADVDVGMTRRSALAAAGSITVAAGLRMAPSAAHAAAREQAGSLSWLPLERAQNGVIAPWSVFEAVAVLAYGADGATRERLVAALELPAADYGSLRDLLRGVSDRFGGGAAIANVLYTRNLERLAPAARSALANELHCVVSSSAAGARDAIARALKQVGLSRDGGRSMFAPSASFGVVNVLNVASTWASPFNPSATSVLPFETLRGRVRVPYLRRAGMYAVLRTRSATTVALPFADGSRMVVYVPAAVGAFPDGWEAETMRALGDRSLADAQVFLSIPKFRVESTVGFGAALQAAARLTPADRVYGWPARPLDATHLARVTIDEHGASISAATVIRRPKRKSNPEVLTADRPFGFIVVDASSTVVLVKGSIFDPASGAS
jgi:serine protease inhibitor